MLLNTYNELFLMFSRGISLLLAHEFKSHFLNYFSLEFLYFGLEAVIMEKCRISSKSSLRLKSFVL